MKVGRHLGLGVLVLALAGCGGQRFGVPDPGTRQGASVLDLWRGAMIAAIAVGVLVWVLVFWCLARYRKRKHESEDFVPSQVGEHIPLEAFYTAVPVAIVATLFFFTVGVQRDVTDLVENPDLVVEVEGFQWQWRFTYPESGVEVIGDNVAEPPELVLPVGRTVRLKLIALDVNHSFWVPGFLFKRDLIPGIDNQIDLDVTEEGVYDGKCAEFCGLDHYRMNFAVRAVPADEFDAWLEDEASEANESDEAGEPS